MSEAKETGCLAKQCTVNNMSISKIYNIDELIDLLPRILYKYRDWDNEFHKKILLENKVYLASPKEFEDSCDCNVPIIFPEKSELFDVFKNKARCPNKNRRQRRQNAKRFRKESPLGNRSQRNKLLMEIRQEFCEKFGVLSLTANGNNDAMWQKYSNNHQGVCFGFDTKILCRCVGGGGGPVTYFEELPAIDFINDDTDVKLEKNYYSKENKWSFEQEYRLHKMWNSPATNEDRNIKIPENCIIEIRLGKSMAEKDKEEIKFISTQKCPKATIIECR